ncbi:MAG: RcnB family protein [Parasphingorhabdus sp.]|uniref:RcnB family protein n=1 Tax=Parasphingorhabdus sp. TaxID=2709688 RepID=UPI0032636935
MKTLLLAGLAGVLTMTPGSAFAAIDSTVGDSAEQSVDLSFASSTALANPAAGAKAMSRMGNARQMKNMGNMRHMKNMGGARQMKNMRGNRHMKNMGGNRQMKNMRGSRHMKNMRGNRQAGSFVRQGRRGYGQGYNRPYRGYRLPQTFIQPSFFISNFGHYGLSQPSYGYGWSRYYDDAVLTDRRGVVQDTRYNVDWDRYNQGYNDGYRAGQATYDPGVFAGDDRVIATPTAYNDGRPTYQGDWQGSYQEDGSYQGEWQGTYQNADGQVYQGEYSGTFIGDGNVSPHWGSQPTQHAGDRGYRDQRSEDMAYLERCKKSSGIGGAVIGGAIGALAGNRIAGRGSRLGGSLIGGGLGAVAGAAIDQGTDKCRKMLKRYGYDQQQAGRRDGYRQQPAQYRRPQQHHSRQAYPNGWNGYYTPGYYTPGYYYPQVQQPMVTTIVVQSAPVTTTTTTTYIEEEVVYSKPKYKKRWKPAAKRVWKPAAKAAPVKGCQQARCMYD